ncbi:hypothetical protein ES707_10033 [subsurface metagenome]
MSSAMAQGASLMPLLIASSNSSSLVLVIRNSMMALYCGSNSCCAMVDPSHCLKS